MELIVYRIEAWSGFKKGSTINKVWVKHTESIDEKDKIIKEFMPWYDNIVVQVMKTHSTEFIKVEE